MTLGKTMIVLLSLFVNQVIYASFKCSNAVDNNIRVALERGPLNSDNASETPRGTCNGRSRRLGNRAEGRHPTHTAHPILRPSSVSSLDVLRSICRLRPNAPVP